MTGAKVWLGIMDVMMVEEDQNSSSRPPASEKEMVKTFWLELFPPAPGKSFTLKYLYKQSGFYLFLRYHLLCFLSAATGTTRLKTHCDL